jgi:hypothetical protein
MWYNNSSMHLGIVSVTLFVFNVPFGYWRAHVSRFSLQWFVAIHLPVLLAISLRILGGLGWELITFPMLIGAFFAGQFLGGMIHGRWEKLGATALTACLVCDLWKKLRPHGARPI